MTKNIVALILIGLFISSCITSLHSIVTDDTQVLEDRIIGKWYDEENEPFITDFKIDIKTDNPNENVDSLKADKIDYINNLPFREFKIIWHFERAADITWKYIDSETNMTISESVIPSSKKFPFGKDQDNIVIDSIELQNYYLLTVYDENAAPSDKDLEDSYIRVEMTQIGDNLFLDFTPHQIEYFGEKYGSIFPQNYIGGHSFAKLTFSDKGPQVHMLNGETIEELLKQRRIRLKHEIVNYRSGTSMEEKVIITASTQELRAFILKYTDDKNIFDEPILLHSL